MRVQINENNEVVNIIHPITHEKRDDEVDVVSCDFTVPDKGFHYINDKYVDGGYRYYIDGGVMKRRSDEECIATPTYLKNKEAQELEAKVQDELRAMALERIEAK